MVKHETSIKSGFNQDLNMFQDNNQKVKGNTILV